MSVNGCPLLGGRRVMPCWCLVTAVHVGTGQAGPHWPAVWLMAEAQGFALFPSRWMWGPTRAAGANTTPVLYHGLEAGPLRSGCWQAWFLLRPLSWVCRRPSSSYHRPRERLCCDFFL